MAKKRARRRRAKRRSAAAAAPGRPASRLLSDMRTYHANLISQRRRLDEEIAAVESAMRVLAGRGSRAAGAAVGAVSRAARPAQRAAGRAAARATGLGRATRGRRPAGASLKDFIRKVLARAGGPMKVKDITDAVLRAGYRTSSKTLANQVSMALAQMKEVQKVGRGVFRLR